MDYNKSEIKLKKQEYIIQPGKFITINIKNVNNITNFIFNN